MPAKPTAGNAVATQREIICPRCRAKVFDRGTRKQSRLEWMAQCGCGWWRETVETILPPVAAQVPASWQVRQPWRDRARKRRPFGSATRLLGLLGIWIFGFLDCGSAATVVWGRLIDLGAVAYETKLTWTPTNLVLISATGLQVGPAKTITATNGYFTNAFDCGDYWVKPALVPLRSAFLVAVPCTGGPYNISNLVVNATSYVYTNAWGGGSSGGTGIATNFGSGSSNTFTAATLINPGTVSGTLNVQGDVNAEGINGSGPGLTDLNATELTSGTLPDARFPAALPAIDGSQLTGIAGVTNIFGSNVFGATFYGLTLTGTNLVLSPTNGYLQSWTITNASQIALAHWDASATETLRLNISGSNSITWLGSNLSNVTVLTLSGERSALLFDKHPAGTNWHGFKLYSY